MSKLLRKIKISPQNTLWQNSLKIVVAVIITLGLSIAAQSAWAAVFQTQATGVSLGNTSVILGNGQNLLWGPIGATSSGTGSFLLFQKGTTDKFRVDHDGNVTVAGGLRLGNYATKPTCATGNIGSLVFDTADNKPYVCVSGDIWKPLDSDYDKDGLTDWKDLNDIDSNPQNSVANLLPENIKSGVNIFDVTGTLIGGSAPLTPINFTVITGSKTNSGVINVSWEASPSYPIDGYKIFRNGFLVANLNEDNFFYSHTGLSNDVTYSFSVSAYNAFGESAPATPLNGKINNCYRDYDGDGYGAGFDGYGVNGCYIAASLLNTDCYDDSGPLCSTESPNAYHPGAPYRSTLAGDCPATMAWDFDCSGTVSKQDHTGGNTFLDSNPANTLSYYTKISGTCGAYDWMTVSDKPWAEEDVECGQRIYWRNGEIPWNCDYYGFSSLSDCNTCSNPYNSLNIAQVMDNYNYQECR